MGPNICARVLAFSKAFSRVKCNTLGTVQPWDTTTQHYKVAELVVFGNLHIIDEHKQKKKYVNNKQIYMVQQANYTWEREMQDYYF